MSCVFYQKFGLICECRGGTIKSFDEQIIDSIITLKWKRCNACLIRKRLYLIEMGNPWWCGCTDLGYAIVMEMVAQQPQTSVIVNSHSLLFFLPSLSLCSLPPLTLHCHTLANHERQVDPYCYYQRWQVQAQEMPTRMVDVTVKGWIARLMANHNPIVKSLVLSTEWVRVPYTHFFSLFFAVNEKRLTFVL